MPKLVLCLLALGIALAHPTRAMAREEPVHPTRPKLPPDVVVDKKGNPLPVWVAYEGLRPLKKIGADKQDMKERPPFRFLQMCYFADKHQIREDWYYLLVEVDEKFQISQYLGWVDERYLIKEAESRRKGDTTLYKKGLLVNRVEFLELTKNNKADLSQLILRKAPYKTAPGDDNPQRLYTILFIYGEADDYYLLGSHPVFNPQKGEQDAREVVLGWVSKERLCLWESREAFEWRSDNTQTGAPSRRTKPGKIYETEKKAQDSFRDPAVKALFEEVFNKDGISEPMDVDQPRFPVLRRKVGTHSRGGELYEVGGIGGFSTAGGTIRDPKELNRLTRALAQVQNEIARTEILFVIDDTSSMKQWFPEVAATFKELMDPKGLSREVRLAVAYYNDTDGGNLNPVITSPLKDALKDGQLIQQELDKHKPHEGGDALEMVFRGICEGIDNVNFSPESRKIVIVLGDCGDISASKHRLEADPQYGKVYNEQAIVERLLPENQSPIEFFAIQVVTPGNDPDYEAFSSQMKAIQQLYNERVAKLGHKERGGGDAPPAIQQLYNERVAKAKLRGKAGYFHSNDKGEVRVQITSRYAELDKMAKQFKIEIDQLMRGQWAKISEELKEILVRKDIKMDDLMNIPGFQVFSTGYVWAKGPENLPQITERLLVNDKDLKLLTELLQRLRDRDVQQHPTLKELLHSVIEQAAGDAYDRKGVPRPDKDKLSMDTIFKKLTGLQFRSPLLNRVPDKGDAALSDDEYFRLLHQLDVLEDIRNDLRYEYEEREVNFGGRKVTQWTRIQRTEDPGRSPVPMVRRFTLPGDNLLHWYWIDYWKEWP